MAFPFRHERLSLRDRILIAIGSGGVLGALGCADSMTAASHTGDAGDTAGKGGQASAGTGGKSSAGTGGKSSAGTGGKNSAGTGGKNSAGTGGTSSAGTGGTSASFMCPSGGIATRECFTHDEMVSKARFGCGQIATDPEPTPDQITAMFRDDGCLAKEATCDGCCNPASDDGEPQGDGSCCYSYCNAGCCGRPLIVDGAARVADVTPRADWSVALRGAPADHDADTALRSRIAAEWLADARMEHASIASFARFTLDLLAVAAPSDLVEAAQRAGLDEVAHARACFALAARYGTGDLGPAALPSDGVCAAPSLRQAALSAFEEGCIGETLAAGLAQAACDHARDPEARSWLARIAEDETRHAELAFRFVAWAVGKQGPALAQELDAALARKLAAHAQLTPARDDAATRSALHAAGRLCPDERAALEQRLLVQVVQPCVLELLQANQPNTLAHTQAITLG